MTTRLQRFMVLCIGLATISMVHACKFYIHNDGPRTIFVYDETQKQHFEIMPKRKILVGDPVKHAHCTVYYKSSADPIAEFRMIACATPGMSTDVAMTELLAGRVPEIFEVIAIERSQKPAKKAGGCSSCQAKLQ